MKFKKFTLKPNIDNRRTLTALELKDYIDFEVKRIYYFYDIKKEAGLPAEPAGATEPNGSASDRKAGGHCHKIEKELFICEQGEAVLEIDDGEGLKDILLKQNEAVYVDSRVWHRFKSASADVLVLALSSTNYNPNREDYVETYEEFKQYV
ncbi:MAG: FdtA/QdtA family cupin domain-containing protein [Patescibacteria group bacterium]